MEDMDSVFLESELAAFVKSSQSAENYLLEIIGAGENFVDSQPVGSQEFNLRAESVDATENPSTADCPDVPDYGEQIEVLQENVEEEDEEEEGIDEDEDVDEPESDEDEEEEDDVYVPGTADSDDSGDDADNGEEENFEPIVSDDDDCESVSNMGPHRKQVDQKRLRLDKLEFKTELHNHLFECHRLQTEIGKKYSRMAVEDLTTMICESGAGHGSDYTHFYDPFQDKYPALVTHFTIYCKRQQKEQQATDLKSSYFRVALKCHLAKRREHSRLGSNLKRFRAGLMSHSEITFVDKNVPIRGDQPCDAAIGDFQSGRKKEIREWISSYSAISHLPYSRRSRAVATAHSYCD